MARSSRKDKAAQNSPTANDLLRSFVERIARLEEEKAGIAGDIKDVKAEAASQGFDRKVLAQVVREFMMDESDRAKQREHESLCEVYRASLGMLNGTPLGDDARRRLAEEREREGDEPEESDNGCEDGASDEAAAASDEPTDPPTGAMSQEEIAAAEAAGGTAAEQGQSVFTNPYVAGDPRRAAWDQGWCRHTGSDGMDIPKAWRRTPKKAADEGERAPS